MNDIMTVRLHEVGKVSAVVKDAVVVEKDVPGVGVPPGGASGQVLTKLSGADYDTGWRAAIGGGENDHSKLTNRDAKDQHPMGAIAGLAEALDGKQPKGDYLTADKLQSATDAALAQAKASGVFDGVPCVPGAKGDKGDTGPAGPQGPAGAPGKDAATDISLGITSATVGQIAKITAVNASGVPTAWEPVDMPSGGGDGEWEKIIDIEIAESTPMFVRDGINCNEFFIKWSKMENATSTDSSQDLYLNDTLTIRSAVNVNKTGGGVYGWTLCRNNGIAWIIAKSNGALSETNFSAGIVYAPYNLRFGVGSATTMKLVTPNSIYAPVTGKLEVWAR